MVAPQEWIKRRAEEAERLYEVYGVPLEAKHRGEYVAIGPGGDVILGEDHVTVVHKAIERFGSGNFAFRRVGVEMRWRRHGA
jgi:hypothetical protein